MTVILNEPFSVEKLSEYTFDTGTTQGGLAAEGGVLKTNDGNDHSFHIPSVVAGDDAVHIVKINIAGNEPVVYLMLKWIDEHNNLFVQVNSKVLGIYDYVASVLGNATTALAMPTGTYWLVVRQTGNLIRAEWYEEDPHIEGSVPAKILERELTGEAATKYGAGASLPIGLRLAGYEAGFVTTATTVDDWTVESPPPVITNPGTKHSHVGSMVKYKVIATHTEKYKAAGLPAGLAINEATGEITGEPTTVEEPTVKLTVEGPDGEASLEFKWVIEEKPAGGVNATGMIV